MTSHRAQPPAVMLLCKLTSMQPCWNCQLTKLPRLPFTTAQALCHPQAICVCCEAASWPLLDAEAAFYNCAGTSTSSNEAKLIGIIVGVVAACLLLLLVVCCCWYRQRQNARSAATKAGPGEEVRQDSVYVQGIKCNAGSAGDSAAPDSPDHVAKMRKLEAMNFAKTKVQPGAVANSPGAGVIGAKAFAFADVTTPGSGAFGSPLGARSPVYTPRGTNIISKLFSPRAGNLQVSGSILCWLAFWLISAPDN